MFIKDKVDTFVFKNAYKAFESKSDFLKISGIVGILTTAVCQTTAVLINKDVPKKERKFMFAQELADGAINLAVFWYLTAKCVKSGRALAEHLHKVKTESLIPEENQHFRKILKNLQENDTFKNFNDERLKDGYINGLSTIIGLGGSIVANNFISPPLRNYVASKYQKRNINQMNRKADLNNKPKLNKTEINTVFAVEKTSSQNNDMSKFLMQRKNLALSSLRPFS
jgi:hypothetical protein